MPEPRRITKSDFVPGSPPEPGPGRNSFESLKESPIRLEWKPDGAGRYMADVIPNAFVVAVYHTVMEGWWSPEIAGLEKTGPFETPEEAMKESEHKAGVAVYTAYLHMSGD